MNTNILKLYVNVNATECQKSVGNLCENVPAVSFLAQVLPAVLLLLLWHEVQCKLQALQICVNT